VTARGSIPGTFTGPISTDEQQFVSLIPKYFERTCRIAWLTDIGGGEVLLDEELVSDASEEQLRDLGNACIDVADRLRAHTHP